MIPASFLLILQQDKISFMILLFTWFVRVFSSSLYEIFYLEKFPTAIFSFWMIPLWDFSQIYFVLYGYFKREFIFSKTRYRMNKEFFLEPIQTKKNLNWKKRQISHVDGPFSLRIGLI